MIMPQSRPMPGEIYRHFKNKTYQIIAVATHSDTREPYVVYQALYGDYMTYIRPYDMFISPVDKVKYPEVTQEYRFEYIGNHNVTEAQMQAGGATEEPVVAHPVMQEFVTPEPSVEVEGTKSLESTAIEGVDSRFLAFLDADSFCDKYEIVTDMEDSIDDHLINQMAASIDVIIEDGRLEDRLMELKKCIRTRARFEAGRIR